MRTVIRSFAQCEATALSASRSALSTVSFQRTFTATQFLT
jgi:hypothetical protein